MVKNQRLRVGINAMRFGAIERFHDVLNVALPIFLVSGILLVCVRFWVWILGFEALLCSR